MVFNETEKLVPFLRIVALEIATCLQNSPCKSKKNLAFPMTDIHEHRSPKKQGLDQCFFRFLLVSVLQ